MTSRRALSSFLISPPLRHCHHTTPTILSSLIYCLLLSLTFVGGLHYGIIPGSVRCLPRTDPRQIRWRMLSVTLTSFSAIWTYPLFFCDTDDVSESKWRVEDDSVTTVVNILGWSSPTFRDGSVLLHVSLLYLGPLMAMVSKHFLSKRIAMQEYDYNREPSQSEVASRRWGLYRNIIVAPLAEETIFRGCMVPPLLSSRLSRGSVTWIAPLFFGTAHFHHAIRKLRSGFRLKTVFLETVFQFGYTTLFGAYVAHAFVRTGSVPAVFLCHCFCNCMGLPDFEFNYSYSVLYPYRRILLVLYSLGLILFGLGFSVLFPHESVTLGRLNVTPSE